MGPRRLYDRFFGEGRHAHIPIKSSSDRLFAPSIVSSTRQAIRFAVEELNAGRQRGQGGMFGVWACRDTISGVDRCRARAAIA